MNLPTAAVLLILAALVAYTVISYRRRLTSGCCGAGGDRVARVAKAGDASAYPHHKAAIIEGMHCENCAIRVANAFQREDGVMAKVSLAKGRVDIYSRDALADGRVRQIVAQAGYRVTAIQDEEGEP